MKTFKQFINENVKDLLTGKSDDVISKELDKLKIQDKLRYIQKYDLSDKFMPSDKEIKNYLNKFSTYQIIDKIHYLNLPKKFMPTDEEIKKLKPSKLLEFISRGCISKKFEPTKKDLNTFMENIPNDIKNILQIYIDADDNYESTGFFLNFIDQFTTCKNYYKYIIDIVNTHIEDYSDHEPNPYSHIKSDQEKLNFMDSDLLIEFVGNGIFYIDSNTYNHFIEDLKKTSWNDIVE